ncbi:hypothetical protein [Streptomyces sp. NRRL WC-3549]|uniref:hypothetical protein n=1 Tax=Streptomyces sp. NRRL WC-3549 TaxID=1463925 RepID=UPI0004CB63BD|nr:hypothetical protein [Streptomyces sp. NRRL WC-3549]
MISEPEFEGRSGGVHAVEVIDHSDRGRVPGSPSPWRWALGGAVVASVLWAASWYAYGTGDRAPDLHGYRLDDGLCAELPLTSLGAAIAPRQPPGEGEAWVARHEALDRQQCSVPLASVPLGEGESGGWSRDFTVSVVVELHKKTDPGPEFEARARDTGRDGGDEGTLEAVPDLGDTAFLRTSEDGSAELSVREGGAVFVLDVSSVTSYMSDDEYGEALDVEPDAPETAPFQPALISDMRGLMDRLKG